MRKYVICCICTLAFICALGLVASAQMQSDNYRIPTSVFSGGGAPTASDNYKNDSTLGQSSPLMDADHPPSSDSYENYPGFWYTVKEHDSTDPIPDIKANDSDGPVEITRGEILSVTIELDPGIHTGVKADWWVVVDTPFGWYSFDDSTKQWVKGWHVSYQGPIFELTSPQEVLNMDDLWIGNYIFYFGVDGRMDGKLNDPLYHDSVEVTIIAP